MNIIEIFTKFFIIMCVFWPLDIAKEGVATFAGVFRSC